MKYKVVERRIVVMEYEIEAESEEDASKLNGTFLDETEIDNYAYELVSCKKIGGDIVRCSYCLRDIDNCDCCDADVCGDFGDK